MLRSRPDPVASNIANFMSSGRIENLYACTDTQAGILYDVYRLRDVCVKFE